MNQTIWIGITIGVFFVGLSIGIIPSEIEKANVQANIERFDYLDFVSFNDQDWETFNEIHASDVLVGWPDGRKIHGIDEHSVDVKFVFSYAPDVKITDHPITFGQGPWTAGMGIVEGTFTEPMILSDGTVIEPTGKKFKYTMITIAKWEDGQITEEYLYWDNAEVARQMGLIQESQNLDQSNNLQIDKVILAFQEKYSKYGITEYAGSNDEIWKYTSTTGDKNIELILGEERVILRSFDSDILEPICTIVNPFPIDVLDYCPPKW